MSLQPSTEELIAVVLSLPEEVGIHSEASFAHPWSGLAALSGPSVEGGLHSRETRAYQ